MISLFKKQETASAEGNDFDFFHGQWKVAHRRLRNRLAADSTWDEFAGRSACVPIVGGLGNVDDNILELPGGSYRAATVRLFDPGTGMWSIWWVDGRAMRFDPPVRGRFENGTGIFLGDDVFDGRPIRVRFLWLTTGPDSPRWEQAFSTDGGESWETNWTMRFTRIGSVEEVS